MFINGMSESGFIKVFLREVYLEGIKVMLEYMYSGEFNIEDIKDNEILLFYFFFLVD